MNEKKMFNETDIMKKGKTKFINLRVSEDEKKLIDELAEKSHISTSKLIVDTVIRQKNLHNENSADIADILCKLAYEIEYITTSEPSLKRNFEEIREEINVIWHTLNQ